ncbi:2,5-diamino-6-ribosylamino-4(3H)-pyrimidinone 5'-phosphate reductase [uncultured archaeon]|nr:2,5-diamino-6-ribosylamino-4(3H)-pyrimidinone 5'-phosphate reductase [uncultured archaeon]
MTKKKDELFMRQCIKLAKKGFTSPNPMVGAVIVKNGAVIAEGYHKQAGKPHAEIEALRKAGKKAEGATMYVNLEPCCHFGKTPPCTKAIIKAGIKEVAAATKDPNPLVAGNGLRELNKAGIKTRHGILKKEAQPLNEAFIHYMTKKTPYVTLKMATTLDGKTATSTGESKWITGEKSRRNVHEMRARNDAIIVGVNTILKDNPTLTTHKISKKDPLKAILDSHLRTPPTAKILKEGKTIIFTTPQHNPNKRIHLESKGAKIIVTNAKNGRTNIKDAVKTLGKLGITSILIEGGSEVAADALKEKVVHKVVFYVAPKIIGGRRSKPAVGGEGVASLSKAYRIREFSAEPCGEDIILSGYVQVG